MEPEKQQIVVRREDIRGMSYWFPSNAHFRESPGKKALLSVLGFGTAGAWFLSQFPQLRGIVSVIGSRVTLYIAAICFCCMWAGFALNLRRFKKTVCFIGVVLVGIAALWLDWSTVHHSAAAPVIGKQVDQEIPKGVGSAPIPPSPKPKAIRRTLKQQTQVSPLSTVQIVHQKRVDSVNAEMPYGLEVLLTVDKEIAPFAMNLIFSGEIGKFMASSVYGEIHEEQGGVLVSNPNVAFIQRRSPGFTPEAPLTVVVYSKTYIELKSIESVPFSFPAQGLR